MKIISLTAENIKKLSVVEIKPDGNLVQITGKNGQGKTSVLDSIWWALAGAGTVQAVPIRQGQERARIRLDLGDIIVTRTFRAAEGGGATTDIKVETTEGARFPSPQKMLDGLLSSLSFDPLAFTRMDPRAQFNELRRFVPGVDFDAIDRANKYDFDLRAQVNRDAKQARAAAAQIVLPDDLPADRVDEAALLAELEAAGAHNTQVALRAERRQQAVDKIAELTADAELIAADTPKAILRNDKSCAADVALLRDQIAELERRIVAREQARVDANAQVEVRNEEYRVARIKLRDESQAELGAADALPPAIDTAALIASIQAARATNQQIARRAERDALAARAAELEAQSAALTAAMDKRLADKQAAIEAADLPVKGITFGDGAILLNGVPFDQASDAEQLRASIAIAAAGEPKLRVIRVRDGSLLDEYGMTLLAGIAAERDYQVWVERVDSSGAVGFVLEDGHLKGVEPPAEVLPDEPAPKPRKAAQAAPAEAPALAEAGSNAVAPPPADPTPQPKANKRAAIVKAGAQTADLLGGGQ